MKKFKRKVTDIIDSESVNIQAGMHLYNAVHQRRKGNYTTADNHIGRLTQACESLLGPNDFKMIESHMDFKQVCCLEVKHNW